jgi:hypothetical protein
MLFFNHFNPNYFVEKWNLDYLAQLCGSERHIDEAIPD